MRDPSNSFLNKYKVYKISENHLYAGAVVATSIGIFGLYPHH